MNIDLNRFKVLYDNRALNALSLQQVIFAEDTNWEDIRKIPKFIEIVVINEDGNIEILRDEAWMFQFIPILNR